MIHFITPLYRYNNIPIVYSTIKHQLEDFQWHLIEGSKKIGDTNISFLFDDKRIKYYKIETQFAWGHEQRNYFITDIKADNEDWCYFLDDDNIVTPDLVEVYNEEKQNDTDFILFSQKKGLTNIIRLYGTENKLSNGNCDIGSFLIKYKVLKNNVITYINTRSADGRMADDLKKTECKYNYKYFIDKYVTYNALSLEIT
jgi:hypothetical protein